MNKEEIEQIQFEQTKSLLFQLQEANNKIEKIKKYCKTQIKIINKDIKDLKDDDIEFDEDDYFDELKDLKDILQIIDGSDE